MRTIADMAAAWFSPLGIDHPEVSPSVEREQHDDAEDTDPYAETEDDAADSWDRPETVAEGEVAA
jgi:hypothetical protein